MLILYEGPDSVPAWTILVRGQWHVIAPRARPRQPSLAAWAQAARAAGRTAVLAAGNAPVAAPVTAPGVSTGLEGGVEVGRAADGAPHRPGGPVLFTSPEAATVYLRWMQGRGALPPEAQVHPVRGSLGAGVTLWRDLFAGLGYQPAHYSVCLVDPRPAVHPAGEFDADAIPLDPEWIPEGVWRP